MTTTLQPFTTILTVATADGLLRAQWRVGTNHLDLLEDAGGGDDILLDSYPIDKDTDVAAISACLADALNQAVDEQR